MGPDDTAAAGFDLRDPPTGFHDDPYPWYDRLRASEPVKVLAGGSVFLTRYDDVAAMYRNPAASSDHLAFGHGEHACAGMNVARKEARIAVGRLLARFPRLALGAEPVRDRRVRFRGFSSLPVALSS